MHAQGQYLNGSINVLQRVNRGTTTYLMEAQTRIIEANLPDCHVVHMARSGLEGISKPYMWGRHTHIHGEGILSLWIHTRDIGNLMIESNT